MAGEVSPVSVSSSPFNNPHQLWIDKFANANSQITIPIIFTNALLWNYMSGLCNILTIGSRRNGERMRKQRERGNGERERKWREWEEMEREWRNQKLNLRNLSKIFLDQNRSRGTLTTSVCLFNMLHCHLTWIHITQALFAHFVLFLFQIIVFILYIHFFLTVIFRLNTGTSMLSLILLTQMAQYRDKLWFCFYHFVAMIYLVLGCRLHYMSMSLAFLL